MGYHLGVDLGTTFVAAAIANDTRVEMFTLGDRTVVTPAVVFLGDDGSLVSGDAAGRSAVASPDRIGREFKRRLGDPTPVMLGGISYAVTTLLGTLLHDVVNRVTETEGTKPESVVLTHPANWGPFRRELFEEVPQVAGLTETRMVTEPEAAAAHYAASRHLADGEIIAVYDLGGGTFDATVLRKTQSGIEILGAPEGIERLGGVDFDEAILSYVNYSSGGALSELDMSDPQTAIAMARLRQDCVLAKESLSIDTETAIPVFLPNRHFDVQLSRADFEDMIRAPVESTIGTLIRTLRSAHVDPGQLSAVLLVGGSSRIPLVSRMISEELGRPTVVDAHPKYAVALGAATLARAGARPAAGRPRLRRGRLAGVSNRTVLPTGRAGAAGAPPTGAAARPRRRRGPAGGRRLRRAAPVADAHGDGRQARRPRSIAVPGGPRRGDRRARRPGSGWARRRRPGGPPPPPRPRYGGSGSSKRGVVDRRRGGRRARAAGLHRLLRLDHADHPGHAGRRPDAAGAPGDHSAPVEPSGDGATDHRRQRAHPVPRRDDPGRSDARLRRRLAERPAGLHRQPGRRRGHRDRHRGEQGDGHHPGPGRPAAVPVLLPRRPQGLRQHLERARTIAAVGVLDTTTNSIVATIPVRTRPFLAAVTPDGKQLYVPNHDSAPSR